MAFNTVKLIAPGLPPIEIDANPQGGFTLRAAVVSAPEGSQGYRFLSVNPAGGHFEVSTHGSVGTGTGLELDGGRVVIHEN